MFRRPTTNWTTFVDTYPDVLTIIADALPVQLELMQRSYVDALVGQLPYNMGYQSVESVKDVYEELRDGVALPDVQLPDTIFGTHQLEILRIPLDLPDLDFDNNYIGGLAILGYFLYALISIASMGVIIWTYMFRTNQVVVAGQPKFLCMIALGTLLMGSAIVPLSMDDEHFSQRANDIACMTSPWLVTMGFTVSMSALFSKTWRLNKIFAGKQSFRRIKVTERDVSTSSWIPLSLVSKSKSSSVCDRSCYRSWYS